MNNEAFFRYFLLLLKAFFNYLIMTSSSSAFNLQPIDYIPDDSSSIADFRQFLENIGVMYSFKSKDAYQKRVGLFRNVVNFTWRDDQKEVIDSFLKQEYKYYVVQGVFGCGKTTMLMGIHIYSVVTELYRPDEAAFISFNVCIKNELIQKLRRYGMSSKTDVRTFDSIVYEICKIYEYPYLDLPNYEGKRKFVYKICKEVQSGEKELKKLSIDPSYIFIDECQDLEHQTLIIFKTFFERSKIVFAGDIFQSIQKETRESLLWFLLNEESLKDTISRHYMKETPRVPKNILKNVKESLSSYYPEFEREIGEWKSSNTESDTKIEWHRFYNYSDIFKKIDEFLKTHDPLKSMILTFSSAITVKGAMGDLARIRRYLTSNRYDVNKNHKKMDYDKLFLSTVNSSKGLERDYVFIVSTFKLERAFVNFSNDIVTNLVTVGVTRAKNKVIFYVPAYEDKFSKTLENFSSCPTPNKESIREGKTIEDFSFADYINIEHCVTELLKQNIIKYDTRIKLRENTKMFNHSSLFDKKVSPPKIETEEERAFVGVLIENLITSSWLMKWPEVDEIESLRNHPMYTHCFKKIETKYKVYNSFKSKNKCNGQNHFQGIYYYSQIHLAMYNKIFIDLSEHTQEYIKKYWSLFKDKAQMIKPTDGTITVQNNMRMPWTTGVSDVIVKKESVKDDRISEDIVLRTQSASDISIWEIKASVDVEWKEDALIQAIVYALMSGKTRCSIVLLNPFRNEKCSYNFNMKNIMYLRELVINDIIMWNINCFLSKNLKIKGVPLKLTNQLVLTMKKDENDKYKQFSLFQFMSPTKVDLISNVFIGGNNVDNGDNKKKRKDMTKLEKLCLDSQKNEEDALFELFELLNSPQFRDLDVYYSGDCKIDNDRYKNIDDIIGKSSIKEVLEDLSYETNKDLKYEADFDNTFVSALTLCAFFARNYKIL